MNTERHLLFPPFRLDPVNQRLWREGQEIPLRQKTFAVLRYLLEHPDQLVTKAALLDALWPGVYVSDVVPGVCIQELRRALGDERKTPRFIVTVHGRGYRFIAPVAAAAAPVPSSKFRVPSSDTQDSALRTRRSVLVGRETELAQLHRWLDQALGGERQIVFVTGEPGIGKSALANAGLEPGGAAEECWVGRGQCIEQFGAGEPYLPVLEAVGALCQEPGGEQIVTVLQQYAPTWLLQLPALLGNLDLDLLQRKTAGATRERMLRELTEALEVLTRERPVVLVLEDLHWSDLSTLEFLSYLARRPHSCRLLVIGTYRPVEMLTAGHPLKRVTHELFAHGLGKELTLTGLSAADIMTYLTRRFPESVLPTRLGQVLHQRTGGNPLFLTSMVQDLLSREVLIPGTEGRWEFRGALEEWERWTPESVRHLLARQRERLAPAEQRVLEAASLAGLEFSAAAVAAALETAAIEVEAHCGRLAEQQQFLRLAGISDWPDGTQAGRYGFLHALYQEFWHERVSVGQQQQWHLRMGERKEVAYGQRAGEIAVELAVHFEQGREYRQAVRYLHLAGENAGQRNAHHEASTHFTKGLELLKTLPDTPERTRQELRLQLALAAPLRATTGYTTLEVERVHTRALELCRQVGETPQLFSALLGLCGFYLERAELKRARELAEQGLSLAQNVHNPIFLVWAHLELGNVLYRLGEFALAREHLEQGSALYDSQQCRSSAALDDPRVYCLSFAALTLWFLGYPDQALQRSQEALTLAQETSRPSNLAFALDLAAALHSARREGRAVQERAEAATALANEQGFLFFSALGTILQGWALAEQGQVKEGITQIRQGSAAWQALRTELTRPTFLAFLAAAYGKAGQVEEGLTVLAEALALVDKTGERVDEAELYRIKGQLTLQSQSSPKQVKASQNKSKVTSTQYPASSTQAEAEACFLQAIEVARNQEAKSLELRAVMGLARLWQQQGKKKQARQLLTEIYGWFTEGFDTADLQEAKTLLEELA